MVYGKSDLTGGCVNGMIVLIREQYARQLKQLPEAYGEAMLFERL